MNSAQINCFLAAAKCRSFSRAAASLYISQPTFSRNISTLEEELGIRLFSRNSFKGIELTEAGKVMLEAFTRTQKDIFFSLKKARDLEQSEQLQLTLGLLQGQLLDEHLENLFAQFRLTYPNVTMKIMRDTYQGLMSSLETNDIDIIYMPQWQFDMDKSLSIHFIDNMETILVVPKRLVPQVEDGIHSIRDFRRWPFITVNETESSGSRAMINELFSSLDLHPVIHEAGSIKEQIEKVEMGEGIILINPYNAICYSPNVHCVRIKELIPQPFAIAWKENVSNHGIILFHQFLKTEHNMC